MPAALTSTVSPGSSLDREIPVVDHDVLARPSPEIHRLRREERSAGGTGLVDVLTGAQEPTDHRLLAGTVDGSDRHDPDGLVEDLAEGASLDDRAGARQAAAGGEHHGRDEEQPREAAASHGARSTTMRRRRSVSSSAGWTGPNGWSVPESSPPPRRRAASAASGLSGSGELGDRRIGPTRQGEAEARSLTARAPGLEAPGVQARVLERDGEPEARTAGRPGSSRVGPPEAGEDEGRLPGPEPDPVVAHRHGDRVVVGADRDLDRLALAVLDGVGDEVAQDAFDPTRVHVGDDGARRAR